MSKTIIIVQTVLLGLFLVLLSRYLWVEEVLTLFLAPIIIVGAVSALAGLIMGFIVQINFAKHVRNSFMAASILQVLLLLFIVWSAYPRSYSRQEVCKDLDNSIALMEDIHPDLYTAIEQDSLATIIDTVKAAIPLKVPDTQAYQIFSMIVSRIKDGHTALALDNFIQRGSILFRKVPPYQFRIMGEKVYLLKNYYIRNNIPIGSEILTINDTPVSQCLDEVSQFISYETLQYRDAWLQLPIFWGVWNSFQEIDIIYRAPEGRIDSATASSGLFANFSYLWELTAGFWTQNYSFEILEGDIGYINLKAFRDLGKFRVFLTTAFGSIKQNEIDNLIIDIRTSGGGASSVSEELMQYISPVAYTTFDTSLLKVSQYLIARYSLDTTKYIPGTLYHEQRDKIPLRDNPLHFKGNCYVLVSGYCFSTALDFPAMVRHFKAGKIVGSETGGRTVSFGSPTSVSLPETGIILSISRKKFVNAGGEKSDRGLIPDYIVENTIEDDIKGIDSGLDSTISLIRLHQ